MSNIVTFNRLIAQASDYSDAVTLFRQMGEYGVQPDTVTYNTLINLSPDFETAKGWLEQMKRDGVEPDIVTYNTLINLSPDIDTAKGWLEQMKRDGVEPNIVTYSTLINLSPDFETAKGWLEQMKRDGVEPNIVTYNTLINLSPDIDTAKGWLEQMKRDGVEPDIVTYSTLINLSPDFDTAKGWLEQMKRDGVETDIVTYNTLINLSPDFDTAKEWLEQISQAGIKPDQFTANAFVRWVRTIGDAENIANLFDNRGARLGTSYYSSVVAEVAPNLSAVQLLQWYTRQKHRDARALEPAIRAYASTSRQHEALRLSLAFPYLSAARRLFRRHPQQSIAYYDDLMQQNFEPYNTTYALAYAYLEAHLPERALPMFRKALGLTTVEKRRIDIESRIAELEQSSYLDRDTLQQLGHAVAAGEEAVFGSEAEVSARGVALDSLAALQTELTRLRNAPAGIGDNFPPEPLEIAEPQQRVWRPLTRFEINELALQVAGVQSALTVQTASAAQVYNLVQRLEAIEHRLDEPLSETRWTKFWDNYADAAAKEAGQQTIKVIAWAVKGAVVVAASALLRWLVLSVLFG